MQIRIEDEFDGTRVGCGKLPSVVCTNLQGDYRGFGNHAIRLYNNFEPPEPVTIYWWYKMRLYENAGTTWGKDGKEEKGEKKGETIASTTTTKLQDVMVSSIDGHSALSMGKLMTYTGTFRYIHFLFRMYVCSVGDRHLCQDSARAHGADCNGKQHPMGHHGAGHLESRSARAHAFRSGASQRLARAWVEHLHEPASGTLIVIRFAFRFAHVRFSSSCAWSRMPSPCP